MSVRWWWDEYVLGLTEQLPNLGTECVATLAVLRGLADRAGNVTFGCGSVARDIYSDKETVQAIVGRAIQEGLVCDVQYDVPVPGEITARLVGAWVGTEPRRMRLPKSTVRAVVARDNWRCGICGEAIPAGEEFHVDHIIPVSRGGSDHADNLQMAHARCNQIKGANG